MSQEKVDYHKEQKRNRQKIMQHEKRMKRLWGTLTIVIVAALVVWFGVMIGQNRNASSAKPGNSTELNLGAVEGYLNDLQEYYSDEEVTEAEP